MAYGKAKQCLTDNGEIGSPTITKAINSSVFKESRVKEKLGELHGTGAMATILQEVADRVAAERAELEAAQAAEIAAEKKRLADLEKQEQARIAADKKREEHIAKLQKEQAAAKKVAEKERIEKERLAEVARQRKSKQDAILVQREAKRLKDEAAKRKEEDEKRARQTAAAAVAREKIRESAYMHPDASTLLEASHMGKKTINKNLVDHEYKGGTYHVERFRTWVKKHPNIFPVASQPMFIADMRKELEGAQDYGGRAVETYMLDFIAQHDKGIRERAATQKKLEESRSAQKKADNTVAEFRASIGRTASAMSAIGLLLNDDKHVMETLMSIQHDVSFGKNLDHLDQMVTQLRKRIGVQTRKHNFKREIKEVSGEIV